MIAIVMIFVIRNNSLKICLFAAVAVKLDK